MTTQPLVERVDVFDPKGTSANVGNDEKLRPNGLLLWGFIMMFIGVAFGVIGKMLIHADSVTVVGVLVSLVGMFLTAYSSLSPPPRKKYNSIPSSKPEVLTQTPTARSLPQGSNTDYVPSITERTTDLLKTPTATTQSQKREEE
jgi:hypothetical protein